MNQDQPNILLLTIDSLRADHCGFMGSDRALTPTLDSLANDGVVFENAMAPGPRTPSSMPEIFTGEVFGPRPGVNAWDLEHRKKRISTHLARFRTVAERLANIGYNTGGVTANPWTQYLPDATFENGFDNYTAVNGKDVVDGDAGTVPFWLRSADWLLDVTGIGERYNWRWKKDWFIQWPQIYDLVAKQFNDTSSPSFFWAFLLDTHEPYLSPAEYREENNALQMYHAIVKDKLDSSDGAELSKGDRVRLQRAYRDATRSVDQFVATLLEECDDDIIVIFHSDHGEAFGEHGTWGHKPELYDENLHVPFFVSGRAESDRVQELVSLRSLPAVVEDLATDAEGFDPRQYTEPVTYATTEDGEKRALRTANWKYIVDAEGVELYSLTEDPEEQHDVSGQYLEIVELFSQLDRSKRLETAERASIADGAMNLEAGKI